MCHVNFEQQKMKVKLAAQAFCSCVATAIEYCANELKYPQFQGSEATVRFIRIIDRLFDMLNSRNPIGKGYKTPIRPNTQMFGDHFSMGHMTILRA